MVFFSPVYFAFLAAVLLVLCLPSGLPARKVFLACASCLFYAAWDYRYLGLLLAVSVIDYFCAARIAKSASTSMRRAWLTGSVVSNLGILAYFKYAGFFASNLNGILGHFGRSVPALNVLLPAGISFYTFKSMSYTIDVYRGVIEPCESQLDYTMFVTFFPELIAGPIVRASVFLPQMKRQIGPTFERLRDGGSLFLLGLTKKVLIADHLSVAVDGVFGRPELYSGGALWLGTVGYALQIYCDFSGYSDMAIGSAKMIGYDLPENFSMPYLSLSITEFWRRWHKTLSAWLRDYLYIPLGGNRKGRLRTYVNLMATMLLGGLWHGASWNFVLWGGLHGTALAVDKAFGRRPGERGRLPTPIRWLATLVFVLVCWVPFRCATFRTTIVMLKGMAGLRPGGAAWYPEVLIWILPAVVGAHAVGVWIEKGGDPRMIPSSLRSLWSAVGFSVRDGGISGRFVELASARLLGSCLVTLWVLFLFYFGATNLSPFIYFQF